MAARTEIKDAPCKGCEERFHACSAKCPKDNRGEYGYKAWLDDVHKQEADKKAWRQQYREDAYRDYKYGFRPTKRRF